MASDTKTLIDVNNLQMFVTNEGGFAEDWSLLLETAKNDGLYYPAGTKKQLYTQPGFGSGGKSMVKPELPSAPMTPRSTSPGRRITMAWHWPTRLEAKFTRFARIVVVGTILKIRPE